ncbi:hypothetical protein CASFOL_012868 [Castilleja foliolosa]|uniref:MATH domain-containing protein n=1 Tax=Castilleja foliolosa TaxID=1961234 RepID=A0ABD3DIF6_9LAMI
MGRSSRSRRVLAGRTSNPDGNQADAPSTGSQAAGPSNPAGASDAPSNALVSQEVEVVAGNQVDALSNASGSQAAGPSNAVGRIPDQLENGSSHYWDCDDDGGQKPSDLYGEYIWEIGNFSEIKEPNSPIFPIGGYFWHIGMVRGSNYLCFRVGIIQLVELPLGWSHFGQVSGTLLNKDFTKSRRLDAFHRFSENAHFFCRNMPISNLSDGYIHDGNTLKLKFQFQVIRERLDKPFRCLEAQYGSELQHVHFTSVEKVYKKVVEEQRTNLVELVKEKRRLSSFRDFWLAIDEKSRLCMTSEKIEKISEVLVKQFLRENEVTSALIMDSIFNGFKAIEGKRNFPIRIIQIEKGKFTLVDDFLVTIGKAAFEALPQFNEAPIEYKLTEFGCWAIKMFFVTEIFSKIEQEYLARMIQEELIREEEAEQKARRGSTDNAKKSKKKQEKKDNLKEKGKGLDEKPSIAPQDKIEEAITAETAIVLEFHPPVETDRSGLGMERGSPSVVDNISSTCPSELVPEPEMILEKSEAVEDLSKKIQGKKDNRKEKGKGRDEKPIIEAEIIPKVQPSNALGTQEVEVVAGNQVDALSNASGSQAAGPSNAVGRIPDQLENGSSHYWDCDDDGGQKPSDLYGEYIWEIGNFSEIKEPNSPIFPIGGYFWHIGMVRGSNYLCFRVGIIQLVELPLGWSHFGQVSGTLLNKDFTKSRRLDAFHRFSENAHFFCRNMPISNLSDGYIHDGNTLKLKFQFQVIRERLDKPFRCLEAQYGSELQHVHFTSVEKVYKKVVEEQRTNLVELVKEKRRLSSFRDFWLAIDEKSRLCMTSEKIEKISEVLVKQFLRENEVTSALIMDSIFNGFKAIEGKRNFPIRIIQIEKGKFTLVDDFLVTIGKAAFEALPQFNEAPIEYKLTEFGCWAIKMFFVTEIFSKIEQEYLARMIQEELIREEEAEQKARRGSTDNAKKSKKKQEKKDNLKEKGKGLDEKPSIAPQDKIEEAITAETAIVLEFHPPVETDRSGLGMERGSPSVVDNISSTCPSELVPEPEMILEKSEAVEDLSKKIQGKKDNRKEKGKGRDEKPIIEAEIIPKVQPSNALGTQEVEVVAGNQVDALSNASGSQAAGSSNAVGEPPIIAPQDKIEEAITETTIVVEVHPPLEADRSGIEMERGIPSVVDDSASTTHIPSFDESETIQLFQFGTVNFQEICRNGPVSIPIAPITSRPLSVVTPLLRAHWGKQKKDDRKGKDEGPELEKSDAVEDVSNVSDSIASVPEILTPDLPGPADSSLSLDDEHEVGILDEYQHLDMINDLFHDEHDVGMEVRVLPIVFGSIPFQMEIIRNVDDDGRYL